MRGTALASRAIEARAHPRASSAIGFLASALVEHVLAVLVEPPLSGHRHERSRRAGIRWSRVSSRRSASGTRARTRPRRAVFPQKSAQEQPAIRRSVAGRRANQWRYRSDSVARMDRAGGGALDGARGRRAQHHGPQRSRDDRGQHRRHSTSISGNNRFQMPSSTSHYDRAGGRRCPTRWDRSSDVPSTRYAMLVTADRQTTATAPRTTANMTSILLDHVHGRQSDRREPADRHQHAARGRAHERSPTRPATARSRSAP